MFANGILDKAQLLHFVVVEVMIRREPRKSHLRAARDADVEVDMARSRLLLLSKVLGYLVGQAVAH